MTLFTRALLGRLISGNIADRRGSDGLGWCMHYQIERPELNVPFIKWPSSGSSLGRSVSWHETSSHLQRYVLPLQCLCPYTLIWDRMKRY